MKAIVAVDKNWGIGCNGKLLQRIPEDMNFFKEKTIGNVVVMGRETFDSLPGKIPLKDRINIVLTKRTLIEDKGIITCNSMEKVLNDLEKFDDDSVYIIGGESVYKQFLPLCKEVYVTKIENKYVADKFFPDLDSDNNWKLTEESEEKEYKGIKYRFIKYLNKANS